MSIHKIIHPIWGDNLGNQLSATIHVDGHYNYETRWGIKRQVGPYIPYGDYPTNDDGETNAKRHFVHTCGLLKVAIAPGQHPIFVVFLDGHVTSNFVAHEMEYRFAADELLVNDSKPIAQLWFQGTGPRNGPLHKYETSRIICTFANKEQMEEYLDLSSRRPPKSVTYQGVTYCPTGGGNYASSDGVILPHLNLLFLYLPPDQQQAFAMQHPEVTEFNHENSIPSTSLNSINTDTSGNTGETTDGGDDDGGGIDGGGDGGD